MYRALASSHLSSDAARLPLTGSFTRPLFGLKDLASPVTAGRIRGMAAMVNDNSWPPVKIDE